MHDCTFTERLSALLNDELSPQDRAELEAHLADCPICPQTLQRLTEPPELAQWRPLLLSAGASSHTCSSDGPAPCSEGEQAFLDHLKKQLPDQFSALPQRRWKDHAEDEAPSAIGPYEIQSRLGAGGMGVVYRGYDQRLKRPVAVKVLRAAIEGNAALRQRIHREAEAIARVPHPNIVSIYEVGEHEGKPFLVLEYVEGGTLAQALQGRPQPPSVAAHLVQVLAQAIHFAHQHGIVHRDLKPSNILLLGSNPNLKAEARDDGVVSSRAFRAPGALFAVPKISDFGLAKYLNEQVQVSQTGDILGTPTYMAPEQVSGPIAGVGPAVDIHALGVILYELLTGETPFHADSVRVTLEKVLSHEPIPPSRLQSAVPRDLDTICLKCLEKEPTRRYATAEELADDLRCFRSGEPIRARPVSQWERLWKWARRRPAFAATLGAAVLFLIVGSITSTYFGIAATRNAADAEQRAAETRLQEQAARLAQGRAETAEKTAQRAAARLRLDRGLALAEQGDVGAGLHWMLASLRSSPAEDADFRRVVRTNLSAWTNQVPGLRLVLPHKHRVHAAAISADGRLIVTGCHDGSVRLWDAATGELRSTLSASTSEAIGAVAFHPEGRTVVAGCACPHGTTTGPASAYVWDVATGKAVGPPLGHVGCVEHVSFNPEGTMLLTVSISHPPIRSLANEIHLWDAGTFKPIGSPFTAPGKLRASCWGPEGKSILTLSEDREVSRLIRWDAATGQRLSERTYPALWEYQMVLGPAGKTVLTTEFATQAQTGRPDHPVIRQRDLATGKEFAAPTIRSPGQRIGGLAVTPDGRTIVAGSAEGALTLWDAATGQLQATLLAHAGLIHSVTVRSDGKAILTASDDGTVKVWDIGRAVVRAADLTWGVKTTETGPKLMDVEKLNTPDAAAFSPDRTRALVRVEGAGVARLWDVASGWLAVPPLQHRWKDLRGVTFSPDGKIAATGSHPQAVAGEVSLWDTATGRLLHPPLKLGNFPTGLAFHPNGRLLATGDYQRKVHLWDVATGEQVGKVLQHDDIVLCVSFSPDGRTLATATANEWARAPHAQLWDVQTGRTIGKPMPCRDYVIRVLFSPDGKLLLTGSRDGMVRLWDAATGEARSEPLPHPRGFTGVVAFGPDGRTFLTGGADGTARLWDTATAKPLPGGTMAHPCAVADVAYAADGRSAVVACVDGTARLWDLTTLKPLGPPVAHRSSELRAAAFLLGGRSFATVVTNGPPRVWPVPVPDDEPDLDLLRRQLQVRTGLQMDSDSVLELLRPEEWLALRRELEGRTRNVPREGSDADGHDARARDAEQDGDTYGALWHLDRLVNERPGEWVIHARRARVLKQAGRAEEAAIEQDKARKLGADSALLDW